MLDVLKKKNQLMLLESFNTIHKKINAKLILVGYGSEENSLKILYKLII